MNKYVLKKMGKVSSQNQNVAQLKIFKKTIYENSKLNNIIYEDSKKKNIWKY